VPNVRANGISIEYDTLGPEDGEVILLISGFGVQMIRWTIPFCEILVSEGYRVVRFDNRDVGMSQHFPDAPTPNFIAVATAFARGEVPKVPYSLVDMARDAVGLLAALGIEKAHIVGRSMGGMIAQIIASDFPQRVLSLTSIMSSTGNPSLPPSKPEAMEAMTRRHPKLADDEEGFVTSSIAASRVLGSHGYPFDEGEQRFQILAEAHRSNQPAGVGRQIAALAAVGDLRPRLGFIVAPTLVIHGSDDPLVSVKAGEDTAGNIKGAELEVIKGMGHDIPSQLYQRIAESIVRNARRKD
jgi:pimeloyl-ACP methyl ester carboxylesterase